MPQRPFNAAVRVNASFWLLVLLAAIISPLTVVAAILTAAALHELGHLTAMRYYGVSVKRFRLTALGAELDAPALARLSYGRELIVTLAGCGMNLVCGFLTALFALQVSWENGFVLAGAHLLLCAFNLLPVPPLDGAHALCLAVSSLFGPIAGDRTAVLAGAIISLALLGAALYDSVCRRGGVLFLFASLALFIRAVSQLRLAKRVIKV